MVARELAGAAVFDRFVETLPPELADFIKKPRLATVWIPFENFMTIAERMLGELFHGDLERVFEIGRRQFKADLNSVYKVFVRVGSVSFIAKRCAVIYGTYTRNAGTMRVVHEADQLIEVEIADHPFARAALSAYLRGTIHAAVEASGARGVKTTIIDETPRSCRIRVIWI